MNRIAIESICSGRRALVRGGSKITGSGDDTGDATATADDSLDLFSRTRRSDGGLIRMEKVSEGPTTRIGKGAEDLLDAEIGKHDYDWLLTPPETPLYPSAVARESPLSSATRESPLSSAAPKGRTNVRSVSNTRPSRLSATQTENGHSTRPVRSSSVTRPSITTTYSNSSFSNNNRTSVLNTSSGSVTSSKTSTPSNRSTTPRPSVNSTNTRYTSTLSSTRPSSSSNTSRPSSTSRSIPSRLPTPTRTRPNPSTSGDRIARASNNSRPSTPTSSRPQPPSNQNSNSRASSRFSTPTRRPTLTAGTSAANVGSRVSSRPSSPGPRARAPVRPVDLADFPVDAPPNLRTKLPERPASAGRIRPGMALSVRANSNSDAGIPAKVAPSASSNRRNYMPVMNRGRVPENPVKDTSKLNGNNGHEEDSVWKIQKLAASEGVLRRPAKPASATESTGFGRNISKKSLDMALRHMDIRQGMGGIRASSLFPQSIRSTTTKSRPSLKLDPVVPPANDEAVAEIGSYNGTNSPDCKSSITLSEKGDLKATSKSPEGEADIHGSLRYDAFILKEEDSKNMNWLHSAEDKSDQSPVFDHRFKPLPEPFGLL